MKNRDGSRKMCMCGNWLADQWLGRYSPGSSQERRDRSSDLFRVAEGPEKAGGAKLKRCASLFQRKERQIDWGACTREGMRQSVRAIELDFWPRTDSYIKRQRKAIIRTGLGRERT